MAIDERSRHELFVRLEEVLEGHANVLMEHLPPVGWADVATKRDLDALALAAKRDLDQLEERLEMKLDVRFARLGTRFAQVDARFDQADAKLEATEQRVIAVLRADMNVQTRNIMFSLVGALIGMAGLVLAGAQLMT